MNQKDKEVFEKWVLGKEFPQGIPEGVEFEPHQILSDTWQAACEYMQAELAHHIFNIEAENKKLREEIEELQNQILYLEEKIDEAYGE